LDQNQNTISNHKLQYVYMETTRSRKVSKLEQHHMLRTRDNVNWGSCKSCESWETVVDI